MSKVTVEARREWHGPPLVNKGGDIQVQTPRRWLRLAFYFGNPPGSHIGFWRTRAGDIRGVNLRIGRRYVGPTATVMVHTREGGPRRLKDFA